jgi:hypothetical protein
MIGNQLRKKFYFVPNLGKIYIILLNSLNLFINLNFLTFFRFIILISFKEKYESIHDTFLEN